MTAPAEASALERSRRLVLPEVIGRGGRARPDRTALVFGERAVTHAELHERAARMAAVLAAQGVGHGDRVALLLHNGLEFVETLLGCHLLGAVAVPVNFRLAPDEIAYILRRLRGGRRSSPGCRSRRTARRPSCSRSGPTYEARLAAAEPVAGPVDLAEDDAALICYTSGTTGRPKGAVLTHRGLVASTLSWINEMRAGPTTSGSPGSRCSTSAASTACCRSWSSARRASSRRAPRSTPAPASS